MKSNKDVFSVLVSTEKAVKIFRPTSCLELKFSPIEINKLAISTFVKSYYFHIYNFLSLSASMYFILESSSSASVVPMIYYWTNSVVIHI